MYRYVKRIIDFLLAIIGLIIIGPLFLIVSLIIKLDSPGPVFFKQKRVGFKKKFFKIYKFRTMRIDAPKDMPTHIFNNSKTFITKPGNFLRKTSLDELPQLINILKGEMSFVGPRPALWNQDDLVREREKYNANDVLPGLTGWAQINGRDELDIKIKARLDGEYVEKQTFLFDIFCFIKTFISVFKSEGIVEGASDKLNGKDSEKNEKKNIDHR